MKKIYHIALFFFVTIISISCRKNSITKDIDNTVPSTGSSADRIKDSLFLYAKQVYLWNESLPSYGVFKPRQYTSAGTDYGNFNKVLFQITRYGINPNTSRPFEYDKDYPNQTKYSFIEDLVANGEIASIPNKYAINANGQANDVGLGYEPVGSSSNFSLYIRFVTPGSPAEKAGIKRGYYFNNINGISFGSNFDNEVNNLNTQLDKNTITIVGKRQDGSDFNITLTQTSYNASPIYKDSIYAVAGKKIGYMAYARFSGFNNSVTAFNRVFNNFANQGVTDLVIDLRYNQGGLISTAEYLINLIGPSRIPDNSTLFTEYYNAKMQSGDVSFLKNQAARDGNGNVIIEEGKVLTLADYSYKSEFYVTRFSKMGSLNNIQNVVFIVSKHTASASELVINALKPYINVKMVGSTTYGKPVGFFPIRIDKYDVYYSMFSVKNARGEGDYFAGLTPDYKIADDLTKQFGDLSETNLALAVSKLTGGSPAIASKKSMMVKGVSMQNSLTSTAPVNDNEFKGMIENRLHK